MNTIDKVLREDKKSSNKRKNNSDKTDNKNIKIKNFFSVIFLIGSLGIICLLTLLYGPWSGFRDWLITSAMTTMSHKYLATWFYDDDIINSVLNDNRIDDFDEDTDLNLIKVIDDENVEIPTTFANEYEEQILKRESNNNDYKIIEIEDKKFDGYLVAIYNPSRIKTVATKYIGTSGQYINKMAEENDALIAINAGGFEDANFEGTGGTPLGVTVVNGKIVSENVYKGSGGLVGFTRDNKLVCTKCSTDKVSSMKIRDAVTFGPFLIVNGEPARVSGNGGWGNAPRTVIGQRQDGIVLFLVLNGRTATKVGATINDIIEIMQNYGAYNACNLDGGTSSALVVKNTIVNTPIALDGSQRTRPVSTAFILKKDSKDNGDYSVVEDKLEK